MKKLDVDLDALVAQVERRVLARIAAALASPALPTVYTTRRGHGPAGWSDERWKVTAPSIPGATKPGRWTVVPRAAFEAWERTQASTSPLPSPAANDRNDAVDDDWTPAKALASVGLRRSR